MNVFNLFAKLTLDKSDYEKGLKDAKKEGATFSKETERQIGVIATSAWLQLAQAVVKSVQAIAKATVDLVNYADNYSNLSKQYDMSTKSLQEFEYIASQNSTTLDSLLSSMTMMYNRAKENDEVFSKLGVSVKDTNGNMKSMDTLFWEVKDALDNVSNSGDKSALMLEAFGRNAMSNGEVLRKSSAELKEMANRANEVGIVLEENTIQSASDFNDMLAEMKLRGKSAFTEFLAGSEGSEERIDEFIDDVIKKIDEFTPRFVTFAIKLLSKVVVALAKAIPDVMQSLWQALLDLDWVDLGIDIGKAILKGLLQILKQGFEFAIGKGWLWGKNSNPVNAETIENTVNDMEAMPTGSYQVNERSTQTIELKVSATGDSELSQDNANLIAQELIPYIDKKLGEV